MKKLSILVACFAVLLVLSNVSFAQEDVVVATVPCACCTCGAVAPALPFAYPAPKAFGGKLAACPVLAHQAPSYPPQALPFAPPAQKPFAARRAARFAQPQPFAVPGMFAPPVAPAPVAFAPGFAPAPVAAPVPQYPAAQMGNSNKVLQHVGGAPVINMFSVVRGPRAYDPYTGYYPSYAYPQPAEVPAN